MIRHMNYNTDYDTFPTYQKEIQNHIFTTTKVNVTMHRLVLEISLEHLLLKAGAGYC